MASLPKGVYLMARIGNLRGMNFAVLGGLEHIEHLLTIRFPLRKFISTLKLTLRFLFKDALLQLAAQCSDGGASLRSPAGAFAVAHAASVAISCSLSEGSFEKWRLCGSANHGGMVLFCAAVRIAAA